jgi:hypothetical protein
MNVPKLHRFLFMVLFAGFTVSAWAQSGMRYAQSQRFSDGNHDDTHIPNRNNTYPVRAVRAF